MLCKFILLFQGRTGGSYTRECLNSNPYVKMLDEVWGSMGKLPDSQKTEKRAWQLDWLESFFGNASEEDLRAIGFLIKLIDVLDQKKFKHYIEKDNIRIIYSIRKNTVKAALSELTGSVLYNKTGCWCLKDNKDKTAPILVEPATFEAKLKAREKKDRDLEVFINSLDVPVFKLCYEDILINNARTLRRISDYINVPFIEPKRIVYTKNTSDNLREAFVNFDELMDYYAGTKYEPMFYEILAC